MEPGNGQKFKCIEALLLVQIVTILVECADTEISS